MDVKDKQIRRLQEGIDRRDEKAYRVREKHEEEIDRHKQLYNETNIRRLEVWAQLSLARDRMALLESAIKYHGYEVEKDVADALKRAGRTPCTAIPQSRLVIVHDNGPQEHFVCPSRDCEGIYNDEAYSHRHADKLGWTFTREPTFSENGEHVAVCPHCWLAAIAKAKGE